MSAFFKPGVRTLSSARCALSIALVGALAGAVQVPALAQNASPMDLLKRLTLEELGNIEVTTASKEPETLRRTPAAVAVLTSEDIRRSGVTSLPEALRLMPGVQVGRMDGSHWAVGVRGFADQFSQSLLVLVDGRSVYTPLFAGVFWSAQDVLLDDIERIEVIRGPGGTIWGANAVNGVINIITKRAKDTPGILASFGAGTVDHAIGGVRFGGSRGDTFDYRVYAKGFDRGAQVHSEGQDFDAWRMTQTGFRADWTLARDTVTVQGDLYNGRAGQSVSIGYLSPPSQVVSYDPLDVSGGNVLLHWRRALGDGGNLKVQTYYDRTHFLGPQIGESRNTFDADFLHQWTGFARQQFTWGLGARVSPGHILQTVPTLDLLPHDETMSVFSAFAQDEVALVPNQLWLTVGGKVERNNYTGAELQPSARVLWTPNSRQSVWSSATRAVRTPSRLERGLQLTGFLTATPPPPVFIRVTGTPDFESERLSGYEAGYRLVASSKLLFDVSAFHNEHDKLQSLGTLSGVVETTPPPARVVLVFPYANGVEGTSDGIEIAPDWQPTSMWRLKGAYSYLHIKTRNRPGNTDTSAVTTYNGSSPRHQALVRSSVDLPRGWQLDQTFRYASALPAQEVKAYVTADARIGWSVTRNVTVAIVGQNLANQRHKEFGHEPPPAVELSRAAYATLTWTR